MRTWTNFWKTKDEKDYEEFLTNPKDAYEKLSTKFQEMDDDIQAKAEIIKGHEETVRILNQQKEDISITLSRMVDERDIARSAADVEKRNLAEQYRIMKNELEVKLEQDYKLKYKLKEVELEKAYNHEVHVMVEEQQDKTNVLIGEIVREAIIGFHNEKANENN